MSIGLMIVAGLLVFLFTTVLTMAGLGVAFIIIPVFTGWGFP